MPKFRQPQADILRLLVAEDGPIVVRDGQLTLELDEATFDSRNVDADPEEELVLDALDGGQF